jgi:hypothetical protein
MLSLTSFQQGVYYSSQLNKTNLTYSVGYPGGTPTGAEPGLIATAPTLPLQTGAAQLVAPPKIYKQIHSTHDDDMEEEEESRKHYKSDRPFNLFRSWGNLSPWYSVPRGAFGIDDTAEPPAGCVVTGLHLLHRHGARYPTAWSACFPSIITLIIICRYHSEFWWSCQVCYSSTRERIAMGGDWATSIPERLVR